VAWTSQTWRRIGAPQGLSDDIRDEILAAIQTACESEAFTGFMTSQIALTSMRPDEAATFHASEDRAICEVREAAGML